MSQIFSARWSAFYLIFAISISYGIIPFFINYFNPDFYWVELILLASISGVFIAIGYCFPVLDRQFSDDARRISLNATVFHGLIWCSFLIIAVVIFVTADSIPFLSALKGATAQELSEQRAEFLKTRAGWEIALNYISAMYTSAVMPFSLAALFLHKHWLRWLALLIFLIYCEASLEKALYLKVLLPLCYLAVMRQIWTLKGTAVVVVATFGIMYLNTSLSRGVDALTEQPVEQQTTLTQNPEQPKVSDSATTQKNFFSAEYRPTSTAKQLIWRLVAVPVFTAADALRLFDKDFDGKPLMGATSTLVAGIFGLDRVPFEALVHGRQFGGRAHEPSPTGRSNSVFFTEAFVNFGWIGVIAFALFIGQSLRWFWKSKDRAFKAVWPLYITNLFQSGLVGNLLSNGFVLFFAIGLFLRVDYHEGGKELSSGRQGTAKAPE